MKRTVRIVVVCLLLGAIMNALVAVACSLWVPIREYVALGANVALPPSQEMPRSIRRHLPKEWIGATAAPQRHVHEYTSRHEAFGVLFLESDFKVTTQEDGGFREVLDERTLLWVEAGWPRRSLASFVVIQPVPSVPFNWSIDPIPWNHGINPPKQLHAQGLLDLQTDSGAIFRRGTSRPLPLMPIYSGLLVNSLFYAGCVFVLLQAPREVRRFRRARRGLCVQCAYELRDLTTCPECGVPSRSQPTGKQRAAESSSSVA